MSDYPRRYVRSFDVHFPDGDPVTIAGDDAMFVVRSDGSCEAYLPKQEDEEAPVGNAAYFVAFLMWVTSDPTRLDALLVDFQAVCADIAEAEVAS